MAAEEKPVLAYTIIGTVAQCVVYELCLCGRVVIKVSLGHSHSLQLEQAGRTNRLRLHSGEECKRSRHGSSPLRLHLHTSY